MLETFQFAAWKHEFVILHFNVLRSVIYDNFSDYIFGITMDFFLFFPVSSNHREAIQAEFQRFQSAFGESTFISYNSYAH